jgi:hypothetical protein
MASPLRTHDQVPIPILASFAGDTQASAGGFPTSLPRAEQATTHSVVSSSSSFAPLPDYLQLGRFGRLRRQSMIYLN